MKIEDLRQGFETAYVNGSVVANPSYTPGMVANCPTEGKKVISSIEDELLRCEKFQISVAFITMGGLTPLLQTLQELERKNIPGEILTTNYLDFSEPRALEKLHQLKNITLKMYDVNAANRGFHSKGYIFKEQEIYRIILGSSNMTSAALTSNIEWNTKLISTEQGEVAQEILREFEAHWNSEYALEFERFFEVYQERYQIIKHQRELAKQEPLPSFEKYKLKPNSMQQEFLVNLRKILEQKENRALLISATGTGKTYAAAFAMRELGFQRVLFLVHRAQLAKQAKKSFEKVLNHSVSMGIVGDGKKEYDCDYVFAMVETLNRDQHLFHYAKDAFDCIILDEAHHSPANTYQKIMDYFEPKLFLGMTATPDKRDDHLEGKNVYELFHYQIAHEIRLQKAMEEQLLCPFHYFGIQDVAVIDEKDQKKRSLGEQAFLTLTGDARVNHVIQQAEYFGYSGERVKGLVFCSRNRECELLAEQFEKRGYRALALSNETPQKQRETAFERLAMNEEDATEEMQPLDYIFSVDILNEGVDIVEVNQVIMLRPTQSPIVFIQQLGRGLRKAEGKEYVVILDFIGNYENNFMIPVALSGDRSFNADTIRKYVISGNSTIPGASTVHFDEISRERIFQSVDHLKASKIRNLIKEGYQNLKNRLGRIPLLLDFYENGEVDPLLIIREYKTYFAFVEKMEKHEDWFSFSEQEKRTLEYLSKNILSGVRPAELEILQELLEKEELDLQEVARQCESKYGYALSDLQAQASCEVLEGKFVSNSDEFLKYQDIEILNVDENRRVRRLGSYEKRLQNPLFLTQVRDILAVASMRYKDKYQKKKVENSPFVLYEKYSRRDVSLLMNVGKDISSTMYGMSAIRDEVFMFVTYHKEEKTDKDKYYVDGKPDYADAFADSQIFYWDSQIDKKLDGNYMQNVLGATRKHLLVKKSDHENSFFYMGTFDIIEAREEKKRNNNGVEKPICKLTFQMHTPVREDLLRYLQSTVTLEEQAV